MHGFAHYAVGFYNASHGDAENRQWCWGDELLAQVDHVIYAATVVCRKFGAIHDSAGKIRQRSFGEFRIRQVDGNDSPEIGVDGEYLRTFATPLAIVWSEFAQNAIVDHFAGHFAGGEA